MRAVLVLSHANYQLVASSTSRSNLSSEDGRYLLFAPPRRRLFSPIVLRIRSPGCCGGEWLPQKLLPGIDAGSQEPTAITLPVSHREIVSLKIEHSSMTHQVLVSIDQAFHQDSSATVRAIHTSVSRRPRRP